MNICESLTVTAKWFPDKVAIVFEGRRFTFRELDRLSQAAGRHLTDSGVERGDRVALMLPNVPAFAVWYYATLRIGAIAVSVSSRLTASEASFVLADCGAKVLVSDDATLNDVSAKLPECVTRCIATSEWGDASDAGPMRLPDATGSAWVPADPDEAALILYTSGTTGFPKGATLSHRNVRSNVSAFNHLCGMKPADRVLLAVPLFHCFGQNAILNSVLNVGGTIILQRKFDLNESRQLIAEEQVTQLYGVPMMFQLLHDRCDPSELSSVDYCFSAAAKLPLQVADRWQQKFGMPLHEGYGLTETSPFASYNHRLKFVPGSIGTPIDSVEMRVVNTETGEPCPPGELGEIVIRGPNVMLGYWNRPDDTSAAIRNRWFHSGDIGRMDENGFFYIVDRVKDMITVGGLKVYPAEVERVLLDYPSVSEAAVVGIPDQVFGEQVIAFLVLSHDSGDAVESQVGGIRQHAKGHLANYKLPRQFVVVDQMPRNAAGKVLKTSLRELDLPPIATDEHRESRDPRPGAKPMPADTRPAPSLRGKLTSAHEASRLQVATAFVQELVRTICSTEHLPDPEARLLDAGLDSLMIVEISNRLQIEVGDDQELSATIVFDYPRICDLGEFLVNTLAPTEPASQTKTKVPPGPRSSGVGDQRRVVECMTEEQALRELLKEIQD